MKLYINITKMAFEEDSIEHDIIRNVTNEEIMCSDYVIELSDDDKFIKNTLKIIYKKGKKGDDTEEIENKMFIVREQKTWWSFPLYEIIDGEIVSFDYTKYQYFMDTERRVILGWKVGSSYNIPSELKILRKTFKYIMDTLDMEYPDFFRKYNDKIEAVIKKNPK